MPAPSDPAKINELSKLTSKLPGMYGKAKYCRPSGECLYEGDMGEIIANSRNADDTGAETPDESEDDEGATSDPPQVPVGAAIG